MNLLQLQNANKTFGTKMLFNQASFSVNLGEHIGVIGPNGAGKSTLFKALVGQIELDSGQIIKSTTIKSWVFRARIRLEYTTVFGRVFRRAQFKKIMGIKTNW